MNLNNTIQVGQDRTRKLASHRAYAQGGEWLILKQSKKFKFKFIKVCKFIKDIR